MLFFNHGGYLISIWECDFVENEEIVKNTKFSLTQKCQPTQFDSA